MLVAWSVLLAFRLAAGLFVERQVLGHELDIGCGHRLAGGDGYGRGVTGGAEETYVAVQGEQILVRHFAQVVPGHGRAHGLACPGDPLGLAHLVQVEAQVDRIARAPRPLESHVGTGEPEVFRHLALVLHVAGRVTVIAAGYLRQVFAALDEERVLAGRGRRG